MPDKDQYEIPYPPPRDPRVIEPRISYIPGTADAPVEPKIEFQKSKDIG